MTFTAYGTRDGLRDASPTVTEFQQSSEGGKAVHVAKWNRKVALKENGLREMRSTQFIGQRRRRPYLVTG